jgi:hypothetical protein
MTTSTAIQRQAPQGQALSIASDRNLVTRTNMRDLRELAEICIASGQFPDIKSVAQAQIKILAGLELGFTPFVAMAGIHFFQGRVSIGANLIASLIKDSGKYEYKVLQHTAEACEIAFYQNINGELKALGTPVFYSIDEAAKAGLAGKDVWKKYPKDMLFAACIRQGSRRYCADVLRGVTPESDADMGMTDASAMDIATPIETVDTSTGEVIEAEHVEEVRSEESQIEDLKLAIEDRVAVIGADKYDQILNGRIMPQMDKKALTALLTELHA